MLAFEVTMLQGLGSWLPAPPTTASVHVMPNSEASPTATSSNTSAASAPSCTSPSCCRVNVLHLDVGKPTCLQSCSRSIVSPAVESTNDGNAPLCFSFICAGLCLYEALVRSMIRKLLRDPSTAPISYPPAGCSPASRRLGSHPVTPKADYVF